MQWDYCIGTYSSERSGREKNSTIYSIIKRPSSPPLPLFEFLTKSLASQKPTNSLDRQKKEHPERLDRLLSALFYYAKTFYSTISQKSQCFSNTQEKNVYGEFLIICQLTMVSDKCHYWVPLIYLSHDKALKRHRIRG